MSTYYDGTKILSMNDLDGLKPEIYKKVYREA